MKTLETLKPSRISPIWGGFPGRASFFGQKQPQLASDKVKSNDKLTKFVNALTKPAIFLPNFVTFLTKSATSLTKLVAALTNFATALTKLVTFLINYMTSLTNYAAPLTNYVTNLVNKMVNNRHLAVERLKTRQFSGLNHQGTKGAGIFTAPLARQATAHSSSCGWAVEHFFRRRNVAEE
jgi:hypothetical protein